MNTPHLNDRFLTPTGCCIHKKCRSIERRIDHAGDIVCFAAFRESYGGKGRCNFKYDSDWERHKHLFEYRDLAMREYEERPHFPEQAYIGVWERDFQGQWGGKRIKTHRVRLVMWYQGVQKRFVKVAGQIWVDDKPVTPVLQGIGLEDFVPFDTAGAVFDVLRVMSHSELDFFDSEEAERWRNSHLGGEVVWAYATRALDIWMALNK